MTRESGPADELAAVFASLSGMLLTDQTVEAALQTITSLAADTVAGSMGSGVSLFDADGKRTTSAATDPVVEQLDDLQYQLDEGPCLDAWRDLVVVRSGDLGTERRWPSWSRRAAEFQVCSVLSAPLINGGEAVGAMKVYSTVADAHGHRDEDLMRRFAVQSAIFVRNVQTVQATERLSDRLKETLRARDVIATARGMIMARREVAAEEAYHQLVEESHRTGRLLREVAEQMVTSQTEA